MTTSLHRQAVIPYEDLRCSYAESLVNTPEALPRETFRYNLAFSYNERGQLLYVRDMLTA